MKDHTCDSAETQKSTDLRSSSEPTMQLIANRENYHQTITKEILNKILEVALSSLDSTNVSKALNCILYEANKKH